MNQRSLQFLSRTLSRLGAGALGLAAGATLAAAADVSNAPIAFQSAAAVRHNMMFIMDDSGSMRHDYLPDDANVDKKCFGYFGWNKIFYNPATTYVAPIKADGTFYADAVWPNAYSDGFAATGLTNLTSNAAGPFNKGSAQFFYTTWSGTGVPTTCTNNQYTAVTTIPAAQQKNYANWYSYYRTRALAMKSAVGRVFANLDASRFRVGFMALHSNANYTDDDLFLNIRDFDQATPNNQRSDFYARLYGTATPSGNSTPLRPALEKAGRIFAGVRMNGANLPSGSDPVQYSCQRNYTILSTDGYWNVDDESNFRANYVPRQLDGSTDIGNQDGSGTTPATARPRLDDGKTQGNNWVTGGAGISNSLADIAMYFYNTDLRTQNCTIAGVNVCTNDVNATGGDSVSHQHMTTFTLGLGVAGQLNYMSNYDDPSVTTGDFFAIKNGSKPWPNPDVTNTASVVTARADDLWHAAVNGRGKFYGASNPNDVVSGLSEALARLQGVSGTGASAATSSLQPVEGDNFVYVGTYTTESWEGNIKSMTMNPSTGEVSLTPTWEAKTTLTTHASASADTRNIYFFDSAATNKLRSFTYANLNTAGYGATFNNVCLSGNYKLTQCTALAAAGSAATANSGANLVNYLRGQTQHENELANPIASRLFRARETPLGDIVNAAPVYVKKSLFRYEDTGYSTFASNNTTRAGVVYAAANDGMLHAFDATTGAELWAYVPTMVLPKMYGLADTAYSHRFSVDGTPVVADVFDKVAERWRTLLIGGLGAGGRGYYALDVTDPATPKALWEMSSESGTSFSDGDLGYTFGNPVVTKNKAGTWVVAFTSGYNNISPGNGKGYLFVRDAMTGQAISKISTEAGSATTPSNLGRINTWVNAETNNTGQRIYGGDMLGNLWRFDFDDNIAPGGNEAFLLAQAKNSGGVAQPITTRPQLTAIPGALNANAITIGTGRLLGISDLSDTEPQSLYVFKDNLSTTELGVLRTNAAMVQQTAAAATVDGQSTRRITTPLTVDWSTNVGWYMDLNSAAGERINVDMQQSGKLLVAASNIPTATPCQPGGKAWEYFFDITNGTIMDAVSDDAMTAGLHLVVLGGTGGVGGKLTSIRSDIKSGIDVHSINAAQTSGTASTRRTSWRELID